MSCLLHVRYTMSSGRSEDMLRATRSAWSKAKRDESNACPTHDTSDVWRQRNEGITRLAKAISHSASNPPPPRKHARGIGQSRNIPGILTNRSDNHHGSNYDRRLHNPLALRLRFQLKKSKQSLTGSTILSLPMDARETESGICINVFIVSAEKVPVVHKTSQVGMIRTPATPDCRMDSSK